jgi:hypothetical protein
MEEEGLVDTSSSSSSCSSCDQYSDDDDQAEGLNGLQEDPWYEEEEEEEEDMSSSLTSVDEDLDEGLDELPSEAKNVLADDWREQIVREDEQFCEMPRKPSNNPLGVSLTGQRNNLKGKMCQRNPSQSNVMYPPERAPPIVDFFVLLTAFLAAVVAAYYSI